MDYLPISHPTPSLAFTLLIFTFISLWIHHKVWFWSSLLATTIFIALLGGIIEGKA